MNLVAIAQKALEQTPPETRFRPEDADIIARHKDLLLSWTAELVQTFYNTLFAHPPTKGVFHEGERPEREKTLEDWWRRTVEGPLDETYFGWMAKVGLIHVFRKVENPMMLSMTDFVGEFVGKKSYTMSSPEALALTGAFNRLLGTLRAVVVYAYDHTRDLAIQNMTGLDPALTERLGVEGARILLEELRKKG